MADVVLAKSDNLVEDSLYRLVNGEVEGDSAVAAC